jgi:hypothetical protein
MKSKDILAVSAICLITVTLSVFYFIQWRKSFTTFDGRTIHQWLNILATDASSGTNALKLKQVSLGNNSTAAVFEVSISYDLLESSLKPNGIGKINLFMDNESVAHFSRETNGNCLLVWDTSLYRSGMHQLQARLTLGGRSGTRSLVAGGPVYSYNSTNLLQFDSFYFKYNNAHGAMLYAKVPKVNVNYRIKIQSTNAVHIKTVTGSTASGEISELWDLTDEHGGKITNNMFDAVFTVTLPDGTSSSVLETYTRLGR